MSFLIVIEKREYLFFFYHTSARECSGKLLDSRLRVASPTSLHCVLEHDTLILA